MLNDDKKKKAKINRKFFSAACLDLQLMEHVHVKIVETKQDFAELIFSLTKSIAEYPNRNENDDCEFFLTSDSSSGKANAKSGDCASAVWVNMLEKFQLVSKDQAYAIAAKYPTFCSLMMVNTNSETF